MRTILLILENQLELNLTKTVLQKLGFQVLWLQKGDNFREKLSKNFPELVITSVLGSDSDFLSEFMKVRQARGTPRFLWVGAASSMDKLTAVQRQLIDENLPTPIQPDVLIQLVCRLFQLDEVEYLQMYRKLLMGQTTTVPVSGRPVPANAPKMTFVKGQADPFESPVRSAKYMDVVKKIEPKDKVFSLRELDKHQRGKPDGNTEDLLQKKRSFVKALLKK